MNKTKDQISRVSSHDLYWQNVQAQKVYCREKVQINKLTWACSPQANEPTYSPIRTCASLRYVMKHPWQSFSFCKKHVWISKPLSCVIKMAAKKIAKTEIKNIISRYNLDLQQISSVGPSSINLQRVWYGSMVVPIWSNINSFSNFSYRQKTIFKDQVLNLANMRRSIRIRCKLKK